MFVLDAECIDEGRHEKPKKRSINRKEKQWAVGFWSSTEWVCPSWGSKAILLLQCKANAEQDKLCVIEKRFCHVWYVLSANIWLITCRDERYSIVRFFPLACGPRILLYVDSVLAVYIVCANCSCAILQCVVRVRAILVHWNWMLMNESICCI